ncbi:TPA: 4Fe-4S binding protein [Candidatus Scatousia excrementigallinarum]|uniref:4Fe-4S binding protein n=1 Tax=Candidatus Scatousia excrementigallinarum TaxID=2840935 RepID=A0A9D1EZF4_9BACT|nr:4Fe-4S binding protein [Candidatus Scatousia excrementigallinarum]
MSEIKIDKEKCKSCMICASVCPKKLIKLNKEHVNHAGNRYVEFVDKNNECLGCALCAISCPDMAIYEVLK